MIAQTTPAPYYAVIFTSVRTPITEGYVEMAAKMIELAQLQPGFLGQESAREQVGITVSYWKDLEAIRHWKQQTDHLLAQQKGREIWYQSYQIRICRVEKEYGFEI